jgi:hypothetical protein
MASTQHRIKNNFGIDNFYERITFTSVFYKVNERILENININPQKLYSNDEN